MIGIVIIGRNEGERLVRCLSAAAGKGHAIVYVDSGSTDDSVAAAKAAGADVVALDLSRPFTAARARNEGWQRLAATHAPDLVQFIDGDCALAPTWLEAATAALDADPGLAGVAGRRREIARDATIYNTICDMEWDTPVGPARQVGGDALYRHEALAQVGGFDPRFICGEEPEMAHRLRAAGWRLARLDAEMTAHDAAMTTFSAFWQRSVRSGWAYAEGAATYEAGAAGFNAAGQRRAILHGAVLPGVAIVSFIAAAVLASVHAPLAWLALILGLGSIAALGLIALRTAQSRRARGDSWRDALLYGALITAGKPAQALGVRRYRRTRASGQEATIIEYKGAAAPNTEAR